MDAQTRRRERRAEKQAQWKVANPLLVGVSGLKSRSPTQITIIYMVLSRGSLLNTRPRITSGSISILIKL